MPLEICFALAKRPEERLVAPVVVVEHFNVASLERSPLAKDPSDVSEKRGKELQ
jgi:hypothetical protein